MVNCLLDIPHVSIGVPIDPGKLALGLSDFRAQAIHSGKGVYVPVELVLSFWKMNVLRLMLLSLAFLASSACWSLMDLIMPKVAVKLSFMAPAV